MKGPGDPPYEKLWYFGGYGHKNRKKLAELAYAFDQEMGHLGISYQAKVGIAGISKGFWIYVSASSANQVAEVIARLER